MPDVTWMDFSGSPALLVPHRCLPNWHGFFVQSEVDEDGDLMGDLELPDGRCFDVWDEFDFENPVTDYDRVCAHTIAQRERSFCLYPVPPAEVLAISDYSDGTVGWWAEEQMILTVSRHVPDLSRIAEDRWEEAIEWEITEPKLRLLHACEFGTQPMEGHFLDVTLAPGRYRVDCCDSTIDYCVMIFRFRRLA